MKDKKSSLELLTAALASELSQASAALQSEGVLATDQPIDVADRAPKCAAAVDAIPEMHKTATETITLDADGQGGSAAYYHEGFTTLCVVTASTFAAACFLATPVVAIGAASTTFLSGVLAGVIRPRKELLTKRHAALIGALCGPCDPKQGLVVPTTAGELMTLANAVLREPAHRFKGDDEVEQSLDELRVMKLVRQTDAGWEPTHDVLSLGE